MGYFEVSHDNCTVLKTGLLWLCGHTAIFHFGTCKSLRQLVQACFCRLQQVAALYNSSHSNLAQPVLPCVEWHACHMTHFVGAGKRS